MTAYPTEAAWPFYVYIHTRKDTGAVFYIGKGRAKRAYVTRRENPHWRNIVAKHGRDVQIVFHGDEDMCFEVERLLIANYRAAGVKLANLTDGGEGTSGYQFDEQQRAKASAAVKAQWANEAIRTSMLEAIRAARETEEVLKKWGKAKRKPNTDASPMSGIHVTDGGFKATISYNKRKITLGVFDTLEKAQAARRQGEIDYWMNEQAAPSKKTKKEVGRKRNTDTDPMVGICRQRNGTFAAFIFYGKQKYDLGTYAKLDEAQRVRRAAEAYLFDGIGEPFLCDTLDDGHKKRNTDANPMIGISRAASGRFRVRFNLDNGKKLNIGTFDTLEEAKLARRNAEMEHWGPALKLDPFGIRSGDPE